jgi:hypothetical protein
MEKPLPLPLLHVRRTLHGAFCVCGGKQVVCCLRPEGSSCLTSEQRRWQVQERR